MDEKIVIKVLRRYPCLPSAVVGPLRVGQTVLLRHNVQLGDDRELGKYEEGFPVINGDFRSVIR